MQMINTLGLTYNRETRTFVAEISDYNNLPDLRMGQDFYLGSHRTGEIVRMKFCGLIRDQEENELLGWRYEPRRNSRNQITTANGRLVDCDFRMVFYND